MATTMTIGYSGGLASRLKSYKAPKFVILWSCLACIGITIAVGFTWGGWVTSADAAATADRAAIGGQTKLAADICVDRFTTGPDAVAQTAQLRTTATWERSDFMRRGGWLTLPGRTDPVAGAADLCVQRILGVAPSHN